MIRVRIVFSAVLISVLVTSAAFAQLPADSPRPPAGVRMKLFLLAGQSNMAGRGKIDPQDNAADPHVWTLDEAGRWRPAVDPIHFDKPEHDGVGPGRTFGIRLAAAQPGAVVGLIPCAVGGVSLDQWKPGGKLYTDAVRRVKIAQARGTLSGIIWHQGEADTKPAKIESYPQRLDTLITSLRTDLNAPDCPLVVGELGVFDPAKNANRVPFNAMIDQYPTTRPNVALAKSDGLASIGDNTHFDAKSQRELGRRYAEAFLTLTHRPTTRPAAGENK